MRDCNEKPATAAAKNELFYLTVFRCGRREDLQWKARPDEGGTRPKMVIKKLPGRLPFPKALGKALECLVGKVEIIAKTAHPLQLAALC